MNRKNKNILAVFISFLLAITVFYFLFYVKIYFGNYLELPYLFKNEENLKLHKKYSKILHHLRGPGTLKNTQVPENYLFTVINEFSNKKENVLMQGDSWIRRTERFEQPRKFINIFSKKNNIGLITSGISSYSPTLMKLQYEVLEKDYDIFPDIVIAYIDQTDIGDELCRYKNKRIFDNKKKLIAVGEANYSKGAFEYIKTYKISEVKLLDHSKFVKNFILTNFFIEYGFKRFLYKINLFKSLLTKKEVETKCTFATIQNYLIMSREDELLYFSSRLKDYIIFLKNKPYIKKIILVTFPHRNHLFSKDEKKIYKVDVSNIVEKIVKNEKKIYHLNFSKLVSEGKISLKKKMFQENDPGSHLKLNFHTNIFVKEITNLLKD